MNSEILAIDPGNTESAYVVMGSDFRPIEFGKILNDEMRNTLRLLHIEHDNLATVIEMVASYGMAVGREVFETCVWIGRFAEMADEAKFIYRKDVKLNLCGQTKAKDANIRQALIDRFARHDLKNGKGTKKDPDWFYGFKADIWQAYAVGVTYLDSMREKEAGQCLKRKFP
jgi:hypothetical protein